MARASASPPKETGIPSIAQPPWLSPHRQEACFRETVANAEPRRFAAPHAGVTDSPRSLSPTGVLSPVPPLRGSFSPAAAPPLGLRPDSDIGLRHAFTSVRDSLSEATQLRRKYELLLKENEELRSSSEHWRSMAEASDADFRTERLRHTSAVETHNAERARVEAVQKRLVAENDDQVASLKAELHRFDGVTVELQAQTRSYAEQADSLALSLENERQRHEFDATILRGDLTASRAKVEELKAQVESLTSDLVSERSRAERLNATLEGERQQRHADVAKLRSDMQAADIRAESQQSALELKLRAEFEQRLSEQKAVLERQAHEDCAVVERRKDAELARFDYEVKCRNEESERRRQFEASELERQLIKKGSDEVKQCTTQQEQRLRQLSWDHDQAIDAMFRAWEYVAMRMSDRLVQYAIDVLHMEFLKVNDVGVHAPAILADLRSNLSDLLERRRGGVKLPTSSSSLRARTASPRRHARKWGPPR